MARGYSEADFAPHERPLMPGSPATPTHPLPRRIAYLMIGILLGLTGGFGNAIVTVNLAQFQGALELTPSEAAWVPAAWSMTNICMSLLLIKFRQQFGLQHFTRIFLIGFVVLMTAHLFAHTFATALIVRAASGITASGVSTLSIFYVIQSLPAAKRLSGFVIGFAVPQIAAPLARVISPFLLQGGEVTNLYFLELGLALLSLGSVALLRLPPSQRIKAFEPLDFLTFALFAPGMALLCAVLTQGRILWWTEVPWLGIALAAAIVLIGAAMLVEHNRTNPLLNTRWLGSRDILRFMWLALSVRVLLSEQAYGSVGLLQAVGMGPDQLVPLFAVIALASIAGLLASLATLDPLDVIRPVMVAVALIAIGASIDAHASNLTRPAQLYLSQSLIAFASIFFMGPVMMIGFIRALARGPSHVVSFSALFGITQTLGGLIGSALLGSFQIAREKFHSNQLVQGIQATNPLDASRLQGSGATTLAAQVTREANILAFNDLFILIFAFACLALLWIGTRYVRLRVRGINPLAEPLAEFARWREAKQ